MMRATAITGWRILISMLPGDVDFLFCIRMAEDDWSFLRKQTKVIDFCPLLRKFSKIGLETG
jgi:hypothetical protein